MFVVMEVQAFVRVRRLCLYVIPSSQLSYHKYVTACIKPEID